MGCLLNITAIFISAALWKKTEKIISRKKLKKQVTAIEPDAWYSGNSGSLKFHQGSLYLSVGSFIWKLDLKTKKS